MKITTELLEKHNACEDQVKLFNVSYPDGLEPTVENAICASAAGFDIIWCIRLLPSSGPGSCVEFALWCSQQVIHLIDDPHVAECLTIVEKEIENPGSQDMRSAAHVAWAAAHVAWAAAWAAARSAAAYVDTYSAYAAYAASNSAYAAACTAESAATNVASYATYEAAHAAVDAATNAEYDAESAATNAAYDATKDKRVASHESQVTMLAQMLGEA